MCVWPGAPTFSTKRALLFDVMPVDQLPIFPLSIVLFPGAPQLLHIFEPRYRQMLQDCLEGDRRFGISFAESGSDGAPPPPKRGDVGCRAIIRSHQRLDDGRSNILVLGEQRYYLCAYVDSHRPYLVGAVDYFDDDPAPAADVDALATSVREQFARLVAREGIEFPDGGALQLQEDPKELSFQISAMIGVDSRDKQGLLAERSTEARLRRLIHHLQHLAAAQERRLETQKRARRNGRGLRARTGHTDT